LRVWLRTRKPLQLPRHLLEFFCKRELILV
jgi:hypothetical protein